MKIINSYARINDGYIYAVDVNVDENNLAPNSVKVDFSVALITEINSNINYSIHKLDGSIDEERFKLQKELETINDELSNIEYPSNIEIANATNRAVQGKALKSDTSFFKKLEIIEQKQKRYKEIHNIIGIKESE